MAGKFGILVGGGPAPGINGVIGAAATTALRRGHEVVGILDGWRWLMAGDGEALATHTRSLHEEDVARVHLQGGSILHTARANPTKDPAHLDACVRSLESLGVDRLVSIGGDDTAFSALRVASVSQGRISVVHVPKTIDNDLPLPDDIPTFGYETARQVGAELVENMAEDCRTTGRWFFLILMGRKAGHLALGAGTAAGAAVTLIPEEFPGHPSEPIALDDVVRTLEGAIVKRRAAGLRDGVAVVAEGIAERLDPEELDFLKDVGRDEHGHIRLADVPLGRLLAERVRAALGERGVELAIGNKDIGYELRCAKPAAYDREYTRALGVGAVETLLAGRSGCLITRQGGAIVPVPFEELMDPETGRVSVRMVDTGSDAYRAARALQTRIEPGDLEAGRVEALAAAAGLSPEGAAERFASAR